ncbi:glycoside hydrolase family 108 protein [Rhodospirillum sp. A1_3_36]|uniref:glycoside hydrolase family 108 protein n=1 Tax=Rhodospirillum sp. A1_3_36 TaxID=3391666 RepID=UPI0039A5081B
MTYRDLSASAAVDNIIDDILAREGGLVDHPDDPGGITNHGISLRYARGIGLDLNGDGQTDADDVRLVTPDKAAALFRQDFLLAPGLDRLPSSLWPVLFDWAVNSGPPRAIMGLQRVLNLARAGGGLDFPTLEEDGRIGPKTRKAAVIADSAMGAYLINALVEERLAFYRRIVARDASKAVFLKGWTRRAEEFRLPLNQTGVS